jgi:restriction system protein
VARSRNSGVLWAWAEAQRRQQRQHEAQQRAWRAEQLQRERVQRAAIRAQARDQRDALHAYQHAREMDAAARTGELDAQVAGLARILQSVLAAPPFQLEQLIQEIAIPPFAPGPLAVPVVMPDQSAYQPEPPSGLRALSSAARRQHEEACRRARAQFEHDCQQAAQAEGRRQRQLADYYRQYQAWADSERRRIIDHNGQVRLVGHQMASGDQAAVCEYFAAALYASAGWPEGFPRRARTSWDQSEKHLVVDWELPDSSVVPAISRYRYIKSDDRETEIPRPAGERKSTYRNALAQSALAVLAEIFRADYSRVVSNATVNGFVRCADPATGRRSKMFLLTVTAGRMAFTHLDLARVDPVSCLERLRADDRLIPWGAGHVIPHLVLGVDSAVAVLLSSTLAGSLVAWRRVRRTRRAVGWGRLGPARFSLPEGPQGSPGSRPGPQGRRRRRCVSSLEAGGAAPYPVRGASPGPSAAAPPGR